MISGVILKIFPLVGRIELGGGLGSSRFVHERPILDNSFLEER